jgi:23S rRNA (adenine-N6)-dimethyltransferase
VSAVKRTPRDERRRRLGQNFLRPEVARTLVTAASFQATDVVVEIGAAFGNCTFALAREVDQVVAIEADPHLASQLRREVERLGVTNVRVLDLDALRYRFSRQPFRVFGSLPFGITTALMRRLFDDPTVPLVRADLVVQWDVARKRAAVPPTTLLSTTWAPWWEFHLGERIPANAFRPVPSVDAAVLRVTRRTPPLLPVELAAGYSEFVREEWGALNRQSVRRRRISALRPTSSYSNPP